jgi:FMN phosphatase YigB (HAD superfamily)
VRRAGQVTSAIVFDVGETLVDETRLWQQVATDAGVPVFTFIGVLGALIARGEHHRRVWEVFGLDPIAGDFSPSDFYPDALACLSRLRADGYLVGIAGNTPASTEEILRPHADFVGSSARWSAEKPSIAFFDAVVAECGRPPSQVAYVGDRVDNDVAPALAAGLSAVHIRRGPWGFLQEPPPGALSIMSLNELPIALT